MTSIDSIDSIKILCNTCYGDFQLSTAFEKEYAERTGHSLFEKGRNFRTGSESVRCDPTVLAIFEEKGTEWSSGECAVLEIHTIPAIFEKYWEIDDYDGNETVRIMISEAYADILHTFMENELGDLDKLRKQYVALTEAFHRATDIKSPE